MNNVEESVKAIYTYSGKTFEILVNLENALKLKKEEEVDLNDVFVTDKIYKDVKKGEESSNEDLMKTFNTTDVKKISTQIIKKGEIQLTTEYRKKVRENKLKQVINEISSNALDPRTNLPIPPQRVENALNQTKFRVNEFKTIKELTDDALEQIRTIIPISVSELEYEIKIPPAHTGKVLNQLTRLGKIKNQDWQNNGGLMIKIIISPSKISELNNIVKKNTNGMGEIEQVKK